MSGATKLMTAGGGGVILTPASSIASDVTVNIPSGNGNVVVSGQSSAITAMTAQASTSGTNIDFTGIPSWVKRITVMFNGVSTSGTNNYLVQVGSGSVSNSGYTSYGNYAGGTNSASGYSSSAGFVIGGGNAAETIYGNMIIANITGNTWVCSYSFGGTTGTLYGFSGGGVSPSLSGALDRIVITTVGSTDTFDAGSINILYE